MLKQKIPDVDSLSALINCTSGSVFNSTAVKYILSAAKNQKCVILVKFLNFLIIMFKSRLYSFFSSIDTICRILLSFCVTKFGIKHCFL
jgi:hypothetical protein